MFEILEAEVSFQLQRFAKPLNFSRGTIGELTQATVSVVGEVDGRRATGHGTIYLSDTWSWPDTLLTHQQRDIVLRELCERLAAEIPRCVRGERRHPLDHGLRIHQLACHELDIALNPPVLARAMCASPFDAAIHDAAGQAVDRSAFKIYEDIHEPSQADAYFSGSSAIAGIRDAIQTMRLELPAWYVVGPEERLDDTLVPAIRRHGYRCFKLKLTGRDNSADVARTVEVYGTARAHNVSKVCITVDTNEASPSVECVVDYLERLKAVNDETLAALAYLEQPTSRDFQQHPVDWRPVAEYVPVFIDEGLTGLDDLPEVLRQGYGGLALKTCKGHSTLLVCAAWARQHGLAISLQDLTNPGISLIHAALVGAHLPTINGAELNSPQFTPAANLEFTNRLPELFEPREGVHRLPREVPLGLGSRL